MEPRSSIDVFFVARRAAATVGAVGAGRNVTRGPSGRPASLSCAGPLSAGHHRAPTRI